MTRFLLMALLACACCVLNAQTPSSEYAYIGEDGLPGGDSARLSFGMPGHVFFKNNEYMGDFVKGYTLTGFLLRPELTYSINESLHVQMMLNVIKYHGYNNFSECRPYFRIVFRPRDFFTIVGGYLEGNVKHDMLEPILNPERYYLTTNLDRYFSRNVENGFQFLLNRGPYRGDLWIDWENFILWGDNSKERFSVGHVSKLALVDRPSFRADLVGEFLVSHRGGQIDSCDGQMQSLENGALGFDFHIPGHQDSFFRQLTLRLMLAQYNAISSTDDLPWHSGWGSYAKAHLRILDFGLTAGHWYGHRFVNFRGDPLYSCWALEDANNRENRSVVFGELYFCKKYFDDVFTLRAGFNTFFDTKESMLEYAYMISMIVNPRFGIKCGRRQKN